MTTAGKSGFVPVKETRIYSQPSWNVASDQVELAVTQTGAHMAPVTFFRGTAHPVQPYYISPWQDERVPAPAPVLGPLRGDFFCLPFGVNTEGRGERHPPHGEACGGKWTLDGCARQPGRIALHLHFDTRARPGTIRRELSLREGHNAVYSRTVVEGFAGPATFAHHAMLALPKREGSLLCQGSPFQLGLTYPVVPGQAAGAEYRALAPGKTFRDLAAVPSIFRGHPPGDCTAFPARRGYCDLVQTFEKPRARGRQAPSWFTAVNTEEGWLWFAFKDARLMPGRVLWMENGGRHLPPWNGRNACLGVEDGCMYFDLSLADACGPNPARARGMRTCVSLRARGQFEVRYIQGVARAPANFGRVRRVTFDAGTATFYAAQPPGITVPVDHEFLFD